MSAVVLAGALVLFVANSMSPTNRKLRQLFDPLRTSEELLQTDMNFDERDWAAVPVLLRVIEYDDSKRTVRSSDNFRSAPNYVNKTYAIDALSRVDPENRRLGELLEKMLTGPDWQMRCMAAVHLGPNRSRLMPHIVALLHGAMPRERLCGAIALSRMGSEAWIATPILIGLLDHDDDAAVRAWAARVLPVIGPSDLRMYAAEIRGLSDSEKNVRVAAQGALLAMANGTVHSW